MEFTYKIQSSGAGWSGGVGLENSNSAAAAGADDTALNTPSGKRRRACAPSSTQVEAALGNRRGRGRRTRFASTELPMSSASVGPAQLKNAAEGEDGNGTLRGQTQRGLSESKEPEKRPKRLMDCTRP